jgi:hypothetical protein
MFPLLLVAAMTACVVALFFLRAKRKLPTRSEEAIRGSHSRASRRIDYMGNEG